MSKRYRVKTVCASSTHELWTITLPHDQVPSDQELLDIIANGDASFEEQETDDEHDREIVGVALASELAVQR